MKVIFDKRTGQILYTIENTVDVEILNLSIMYGIIEVAKETKISDYFVDLNTFNLSKKNEVFLNFLDDVLYINSLDLTVNEITLCIENIDGFKSVLIPLLNGVCSVPIVSNCKFTKFSVFDLKNKSKVLEINNDKETVNLELGLVL